MSASAPDLRKAEDLSQASAASKADTTGGAELERTLTAHALFFDILVSFLGSARSVTALLTQQCHPHSRSPALVY